MAAAEMNAIDILVAIIKEHSPKDIWIDSPLADYRRLGNTNRGKSGRNLSADTCAQTGLKPEMVIGHR